MSSPIHQWSGINIRTANILCEARNQGLLGMVAVDWVVYNRSQRRGWPDTMRGVILQRLQFSWTRQADPNFQWVLGAVGSDNPVVKKENWDNFRNWVQVWDTWRQDGATQRNYGNPQIMVDPTQGADHYLNVPLVRKWRKGKLPRWANEKKITTVIGDHTFYQLRS